MAAAAAELAVVRPGAAVEAVLKIAVGVHRQRVGRQRVVECSDQHRLLWMKTTDGVPTFPSATKKWQAKLISTSLRYKSNPISFDVM